MHIDIWSDIVCPYCYVATFELKKALENFAHSDRVTLSWKSFELDPEAPAQPQPLLEHLQEKYAHSDQQLRSVLDDLARRASDHGEIFAYDKALTCSSTDAHRLVKYAQRYGCDDELRLALMKAFFTQGAAISDHETLISIAKSCGLDADSVAQFLATDELLDQVRSDLAEAMDLNIAGVPSFVIDGQYLITGVQDAEIFCEALDQIWAESHRPQFIELGSGFTPGTSGCGCGGCGCQPH